MDAYGGSQMLTYAPRCNASVSRVLLPCMQYQPIYQPVWGKYNIYTPCGYLQPLETILNTNRELGVVTILDFQSWNQSASMTLVGKVVTECTRG
jgi:hypothetical protein